MRITDDTVEGAIAAGLVKDGVARELPTPTSQHSHAPSLRHFQNAPHNMAELNRLKASVYRALILKTSTP